jgi:hypothetical protein
MQTDKQKPISLSLLLLQMSVLKIYQDGTMPLFRSDRPTKFSTKVAKVRQPAPNLFVKYLQATDEQPLNEVDSGDNDK